MTRPQPGNFARTARPASTINVPLPDRYSIIKLLGKGGMGTVYLGRDSVLQREVAIKVPLITDPEQLQRFSREARAAAKLHHPNLCSIHDVGEHKGQPYLTMAYIDGTSLEDDLKKRKTPLDPVKAVKLVQTLALAMQKAHDAGITHRDLKPGNIMLTQDRRPIIMDFGLARLENSNESLQTRTGQMMGTPAYMPLEQFKGDLQLIGPRSDIYSLGVILFQLLTGKLPFEGGYASIVAQLLQSSEPPRPSRLCTGLDPRLDSICSKAMAIQVGDRYPSMSAFASDLTAFVGGQPVEDFVTFSPGKGPTVVPSKPGRVANPASPYAPGGLAGHYNRLEDSVLRLKEQEDLERSVRLVVELARCQERRDRLDRNWAFLPYLLFAIQISLVTGIVLYNINSMVDPDSYYWRPDTRELTAKAKEIARSHNIELYTSAILRSSYSDPPYSLGIAPSQDSSKEKKANAEFAEYQVSYKALCNDIYRRHQTNLALVTTLGCCGLIGAFAVSIFFTFHVKRRLVQERCDTLVETIEREYPSIIGTIRGPSPLGSKESTRILALALARHHDMVDLLAQTSKYLTTFLAIFFGVTGWHKFKNGLVTEGMIIIVVSLTILGLPVTFLIGLIEGTKYAFMDTDDYFEFYLVKFRGWF